MSSLTFHFAIFLFTTLLLTSHQGIEAFTAGLFLTITYIGASFKLIIFIFHRQKIDNLLTVLRSSTCKAKDASETKISDNYQWKAKYTFVVRLITSLGCTFFFLTAALMNVNAENWELPYNAYQIFNISSTVPYVLAFAGQITTVVCSIWIDVAIDSTAWAFMILICNQLELLAHRIKYNRVTVNNCVDHHNLIFRMVRDMQSCFISIIVPTFSCALFTLCSTIFQLAQKNNNFFRSLSLLMYITTLLVQLYYFCWFGNELQLKNETVTNAIFESQWLKMRLLQKKNYWFVMFMGRKELKISYHGLLVLNVRTFTWMLETTYAAFNLLQRFSV